ncbi:MAG: hypothetical protein AABX05_04595 [Nanoarchaeota archaeon]
MNIDELAEKVVQIISEEEVCPLGEGDEGLVYAVDDKVVLKLHNDPQRSGYYRSSSKNNAKYEFELGSYLHQLGVQVPEYFGLFRPARLPGLNYWGLFMERIYGIAVYYPKIVDSAKKQFEEQKKLLWKLGYRAEDVSFSQGKNLLFDSTKEKLYLFDLVRWEKN